MSQNKTPYHLRHIACNMNDFQNDCHRFRFEYKEKEYTASCYGKITVVFDNDNLPEEVKEDLTNMIYAKIDKEENKWRYPEEAYRIVDEYYEEEFNR